MDIPADVASSRRFSADFPRGRRLPGVARSLQGLTGARKLTTTSTTSVAVQL